MEELQPAGAAEEPGPPPERGPAEADAPSVDQSARVSFTGRGSEYFRIWIVNVALTILTLGLYSAWAKVRRLQYFHRNTRLAGAAFDYHGDPIVIFKGRLVGGALFLAYTMAGYVSPFLALAAMGVIACLLPWMLCRSLRFKLQNTSYRGLRFRFTGSTRSAYWVFLALPLFTLLTFFTLGPFLHQRLKRYQYNNASYGEVPFRSSPPVSDFYMYYIGAGFLGVVLAGAFAAVIGGLVALVPSTDAGGLPSDAATTLALVSIGIGFVFYIAGLLTVQAFLTAHLRNLVWNHTAIAAQTFKSTVRVRTLLWITLTNLAATIGTLGLFWPYAQVRIARCLAEAVVMHGPEEFAQFTAGTSVEEGAVGDEVAGFFDFDIAF